MTSVFRNFRKRFSGEEDSDNEVVEADDLLPVTVKPKRAPHQEDDDGDGTLPSASRKGRKKTTLSKALNDLVGNLRGRASLQGDSSKSKSTTDASSSANRPSFERSSTVVNEDGVPGGGERRFVEKVVAQQSLIKLQKEMIQRVQTKTFVQQDVQEFRDALLTTAWTVISEGYLKREYIRFREAENRVAEIKQQQRDLQTAYFREITALKDQMRRLPDGAARVCNVTHLDPLKTIDPELRPLVEACIEERLKTCLCAAQEQDNDLKDVVSSWMVKDRSTWQARGEAAEVQLKRLTEQLAETKGKLEASTVAADQFRTEAENLKLQLSRLQDAQVARVAKVDKLQESEKANLKALEELRWELEMLQEEKAKWQSVAESIEVKFKEIQDELCLARAEKEKYILLAKTADKQLKEQLQRPNEVQGSRNLKVHSKQPTEVISASQQYTKPSDSDDEVHSKQPTEVISASQQYTKPSDSNDEETIKPIDASWNLRPPVAVSTTKMSTMPFMQRASPETSSLDLLGRIAEIQELLEYHPSAAMELHQVLEQLSEVLDRESLEAAFKSKPRPTAAAVELLAKRVKNSRSECLAARRCCLALTQVILLCKRHFEENPSCTDDPEADLAPIFSTYKDLLHAAAKSSGRSVSSQQEPYHKALKAAAAVLAAATQKEQASNGLKDPDAVPIPQAPRCNTADPDKYEKKAQNLVSLPAVQTCKQDASGTMSSPLSSLLQQRDRASAKESGDASMSVPLTFLLQQRDRASAKESGDASMSVPLTSARNPHQAKTPSQRLAVTRAATTNLSNTLPASKINEPPLRRAPGGGAFVIPKKS